MTRRALLFLTAVVALSCARESGGRPPPPAAADAGVSRTLVVPPPKLSRADFNRFAVRLNLPLFWAADSNGDGMPERDEVKTLLFYPSSDSVDVDGGIAAIVAFDPAAFPAGLSADELTRRKLVADDLDQGYASLVDTDLRGASTTDKAFVGHMLTVAKAIDDLYATVHGAKVLAARLPADDPASQSLFRRGWGPACIGPKTPKGSVCSAIPGGPKAVSDAYPARLQTETDFCAALQKRPGANAAMSDHFAVVREKDGKLVSVPYTQAYAEPMRAIAAELRAAAADETDPSEAALKAYLEAAAQSFTTNDWQTADEAWSRMNAQNSRWYVRVAPDEVLSDVCKVKAQFHLNLARFDQGSVRWQSKLTPLRQEMEGTLAALVGAPYKARKVTFHMPEFIEIVLNAGDDRLPFDAILGEGLPNWGKVTARTVAMTNFGKDPDTRAISRKRAESMLDAATAAAWSDGDEPELVDTILHETTHNLGPMYSYEYQGKTGAAAMGGATAAMFEELKAETGAMYWLDGLVKKGVVSPELARQSYAGWLSGVLYGIAAFGVHSGLQSEPYAQLAAIQVGFLLDEGALTFDAGAVAANGVDRGAFAMHFEKLAPAFEKLIKVVLTIKAKNDKAGAEAMIARYVDGPVVPIKVILERELRFPKGSVVYRVDR